MFWILEWLRIISCCFVLPSLHPFTCCLFSPESRVGVVLVSFNFLLLSNLVLHDFQPTLWHHIHLFLHLSLCWTYYLESPFLLLLSLIKSVPACHVFTNLPLAPLTLFVSTTQLISLSIRVRPWNVEYVLPILIFHILLNVEKMLSKHLADEISSHRILKGLRLCPSCQRCLSLIYLVTVGGAKYDRPVTAPSQRCLVMLTLHGCSVKWELWVSM